jgi:hypothetical protein
MVFGIGRVVPAISKVRIFAYAKMAREIGSFMPKSAPEIMDQSINSLYWMILNNAKYYWTLNNGLCFDCGSVSRMPSQFQYSWLRDYFIQKGV